MYDGTRFLDRSYCNRLWKKVRRAMMEGHVLNVPFQVSPRYEESHPEVGTDQNLVLEAALEDGHPMMTRKRSKLNGSDIDASQFVDVETKSLHGTP